MTSPTAPLDPPAYSVTGFCKAHDLSRAMFYKLCASDRGPEVIKVGRRTLVPGEAAAAWRMRLLALGKEAKKGR